MSVRETTNVKMLLNTHFALARSAHVSLVTILWKKRRNVSSHGVSLICYYQYPYLLIVKAFLLEPVSLSIPKTTL